VINPRDRAGKGGMADWTDGAGQGQRNSVQAGSQRIGEKPSVAVEGIPFVRLHSEMHRYLSVRSASETAVDPISECDCVAAQNENVSKVFAHT
jgi:hypothetical protein